MRSEVELQLAKEQKLLKESVGLAAKIVGAAITLFLAIFTIFGLTTWQQIKQETGQIVKQEAEALLQKADSETSVKDTLNDLLNRTVVSSFLAAQVGNKGHAVTLAINDWERLRNWIKKEDLPFQDFADTLAVLNLQSDERKKTDANRLLAELLNPPEQSPYKWITKQPEKTSFILASFKHRDLGLSAAELVTSKALTDSIRSEAAVYVREVEFSEGVERLLASYKTLAWGAAKKEALITCVVLKPEQSEVVLELKRLLVEEPQREKIEATAQIVVQRLRRDLMPDSSVSEVQPRAMLKDILLYATKNGLFFSLSYPERNQMPSDTEDAPYKTPTAPSPRISLMLSTSKNSASGVGVLSISEFRKFQTYWDLLAEIANAGDIARFRTLLLREGFGSSSYMNLSRERNLRVMISADAGAIVTVSEKGGTKKDIELKDLKDVQVIATHTISDPAVELHWSDKARGLVTAQLEGLKGTHFVFQLQRFEPSE